jgi:SAM-dependent methyltransferase
MRGLASASATLPVRLVCPACGSELVYHSQCPCSAGTRLERWNGLPRILFDQEYRGEFSREQMHDVLGLLPGQPWREALAQVADGQPAYHEITAKVGADFIYSMPWDEIHTVLDIGAGMGFMAAPMAEFAGHVVALEPVPERALFLSRRGEQDALTNVHPIVASPTAMPFAPNSFDLITLNGSFDDIGIRHNHVGVQRQEEFLTTVYRLLRSGGYLYFGTKTQFGRARSLRRYEAMLRQAGFETVEVHGCFGGYRQQRANYPMKDYATRREVHRLLDPSGSCLGSLRRRIVNCRLWYEKLEKEAVLFSRKARSDDPLTWSFLDAAGTVAQINMPDKVLALTFVDNRPTTISLAGKNAEAERRLDKEYRLLEQAQHAHGQRGAALSVRWPRPFGKKSGNGLTYYQYEYATGFLLSNLLLPGNSRPAKFNRLFGRLVEGYADLCSLLSTKPSTATDSGNIDELAQIDLDDRSLMQRIKEACRRLVTQRWPTGVNHGDLSLCNTIVLPNETMVLIDWENACTAGLVAIDLVRLLYDTSVDTGWMKPRTRQQIMTEAKHRVQKTLERLDVQADDFPDLEALFVAHQWRFLRARQGDSDGVLRAYRNRDFSLS